MFDHYATSVILHYNKVCVATNNVYIIATEYCLQCTTLVVYEYDKLYTFVIRNQESHVLKDDIFQQLVLLVPKIKTKINNSVYFHYVNITILVYRIV